MRVLPLLERLRRRCSVCAPDLLVTYSLAPTSLALSGSCAHPGHLASYGGTSDRERVVWVAAWSPRTGAASPVHRTFSALLSQCALYGLLPCWRAQRDPLLALLSVKP